MKGYKMNMPEVENMRSPRGYIVPNQFIITVGNDKYFQSYSSIIAVDRFGKYPKIFLDKNHWNYSSTTSKYRNIFLNETTKETRAKIKSGEYKLRDLNK